MGPDGGLKKIVLATGNAGKAREIKEIFKAVGIEVRLPAELGLQWEPPEEGETSFRDNALLKARSLAEAAGEPALADDSGLVVDALGGAPGVTSSRFGGDGLDDTGRYGLLLERMFGRSDRTARFVCVAAFCTPDGECHTAEGHVSGRIIESPRGSGGFGYDPVFLADGQELTMAELDADTKNSISHRGLAFRNLRQILMNA